MPKTPSSKLFHLVKSLSSAEKRYFKIFINSKESATSKYAQLFDAIDAQAEFDDEALRQSVYGDEPVETRKYSELKAYLYDLVLKSLQAYDEKSSIDYKLKNMLLGVRTLFKRSHFEDCKELLGKAKKVAALYEDFNTLIEILAWEKMVAYAQMDIAFLDKKLSSIEAEEADYLLQLKNISSYKSIFFKILVSIRKDVSRSEKQKSELSRLMQEPLLENVQFAQSYTAKVLFYRIHSIYNFSASQFGEFYQTSKKLIALMEENPLFLAEDVSEYISALNNHMVSCGRVDRLDEFMLTLNKLKKVNPITVDDALKIHRQYYQGKFRYCINAGEFEEGIKELKEHLQESKKFDLHLFQKSDFYFQYFCIYFGNNDFEKALDSLNEWMQLTDNVERKDLQALARILNLIVHFELGNTILLDSLIRSTYRYLNKENRLFEFERKAIEFIREASRSQSKKEMRQLYENLKQDFEQLSHSPAFGVFQLFDIIAWLDSKISGKSFAAIVKQKFQESLKPKNDTGNNM
jgi:tetratricopeptide (TPR) repeat protein